MHRTRMLAEPVAKWCESTYVPESIVRYPYGKREGSPIGVEVSQRYMSYVDS